MSNLFALAAALLAGCSILPTVRNPDYCVSNTDCDPGSICNLDSHACEAPPDADPDAVLARCNPTGAFGAPELVIGVNSGFDEQAFALTEDELTVYVVRDEATTFTVQSATRGSRDVDFSAPMLDPQLEAINDGLGQELDYYPARSGLVMVFSRQGRPTLASRTATSQGFSAGRAIVIDNVPAASLTGVRIQPTPDALSIYWIDRDDRMLRVAHNIVTEENFRLPSQISTMPMTQSEVSPDELSLYYTPLGTDDIYVSTRLTKTVAFEPGTLIPSVSDSPANPVWVSRDECVLYFLAPGAATRDVFVARRER